MCADEELVYRGGPADPRRPLDERLPSMGRRPRFVELPGKVRELGLATDKRACVVVGHLHPGVPTLRGACACPGAVAMPAADGSGTTATTKH